MQHRRILSGAVWESKVGYCRALRVGNQIYIAGTAPVDEEGGVFAPGKGTGLGLSISYRIVQEKHGGRLKCVSALGQGAEFLIKIPIRQ